MILANFNEADADPIEAVGRIALATNHLTRSEALQFYAVAEVINKVLRERCKNGNALQVSLECTATIVGIKFRSERLVLLQNVEHVAQHLEANHIFCRDHCCAAGIEVHARHLAEQIARVKLRNWMVVFKINWRVDIDKLARRVFFLALVLLARLQLARKLAEESFLGAFGIDVSSRRGDKDVYSTLYQIEGCGAVIALAADDLAFPVHALYHRAFVQLQEGAGDTLKHRQLQELLGFD